MTKSLITLMALDPNFEIPNFNQILENQSLIVPAINYHLKLDLSPPIGLKFPPNSIMLPSFTKESLSFQVQYWWQMR